MAERHGQMVENNSLKIENICRTYNNGQNGQVEVLREINMNALPGEIIAVVGPSGCGKSTFLRLIAGLDIPEEGRIVYKGREIKMTDPKVGFVFQNSNLFPWLTVRENIEFGLKAAKTFKEEKTKVGEYIRLVGLEGFEEAYPYQLSGGMASRVSLARTFIKEPELILLDEPLSALDAFTKITIQDEILKIWNKNKPIIILVTHDIEEAVYLSHRVMVMSERPGSFTGSVKIDIPHPRDRVSDVFVEKRKEILRLMNTGKEERG